MGSYLSTLPINKLRMQVGVRSYSNYYYIWPDFILLAKKLKLVLNCYLKNFVAITEDILSFFFKLFNNCRSHNTCCRPRPLGLYVLGLFGFCFAKNRCAQFFPVLPPPPPPAWFASERF